MQVRQIPIHNIIRSLEELVKYTSKERNKTSVLAIAGGSGSGKSVIAEYIASKSSDAVIISIDDYFRGSIKRADNIKDFDHPDCYNLAKVNLDLRMLKAKKEIEKPTYDKATKKHGRETVKTRDNTIIIIEGLHALNLMVRGEIDFGVFVDVDPDIRWDRRVFRDMQKFRKANNTFEYSIEKIRKIWKVAEIIYYQEIAPTQNYANFIINNDKPSKILNSEQAAQSTPRIV